ncbi:polysaccharide deacetylase [Leptospira kirschneri serovar Bim str. 1051]|uniref:polysaccharide deacetylase family protein n=1 Tax=Leptospira kirschneri TaxID=29507 RepID=UPI000288A33E|nr:polysaccharide deacetylase family protein [Leptospira kirschneri]EMK15697.1 polysaccharide deacetylase [Leptospira kirschneri serovar Bim str. PUO 1247]EMN05064.1 polysaccharide deacetylase [Leptospira kirschneri serovar Bim str. 1051]
MNKIRLPDNLCLVFHCIKKSDSLTPLVYPELFVELNDIKDLCQELKNQDYHFCLPETAIEGRKNCIITFDDGYFNNKYFLEVAEALEIPFVIFLASYNIQNQSPFIWDLAAFSGKSIHFWKSDYALVYPLFESKVKEALSNLNHKPLNFTDIEEMSKSKYVHFAFHGHYHQPMVRFGEKFIERELTESKKFMNQLSCNKLNHFAFPNGLYTFYSLSKIKKEYDFVYSIIPGRFKVGSNCINRYSLINPEFAGSFFFQISKSSMFHRKLYTRLKTVQLSYF